jgi:hypothetical protein
MVMMGIIKEADGYPYRQMLSSAGETWKKKEDGQV